MKSIKAELLTEEERFDEEERKKIVEKEEERKKIQDLKKFIREVIDTIKFDAEWQIFSENSFGIKITKKRVHQNSDSLCEFHLTWLKTTEEETKVFSEEALIENFCLLTHAEDPIDLLKENFRSTGRKVRLIRK
ncbi:MAG: hypothetical protein KAI57_00375 [Candidatus Pacebacteria bacterium]|nr:hypothetical protein [Candidatus Paceibacterota bacterium]